MAVYTRVSNQEISIFISEYPVGSFENAEGILQGIDNSNYKVETDLGRFVLTIFEDRVNRDDLPYYLGFMEHLADQGILCPAPVALHTGGVISEIGGKAAALFPFLDGRGVLDTDITPALCGELGEFLARMHMSGQSFPKHRHNCMSFDAWELRLKKVSTPAALSYLDTLAQLRNLWPTDLPKGAVHADLFPDNVFILDEHIHGVIDFYFSCTDFLAYDLAIVLNAWCFDPDHVLNINKAKEFLDGYQSIRALTEHEKSSFQILGQGAALRFLSSRLHDLTFHDPNALVTPKDPAEYIKKLEFHRDCALF
ncbi:MAG TPA: homoserine kinase [Alphaproteobacteria bacterium]|nr:homoserine kinase [Alphaproteobacteria bacterium]